MRDQDKGVTLIELMIAVAFVSAAVAAISLLFPKASASITNNRQRFLASNFAAADIQELKEKPYAVIAVTDPVFFLTTNLIPYTLAGGCSCISDMISMPTDATYTEDGVTYTRQSCIDFVDHPTSGPGAWNTYCPNPPFPIAPITMSGPDYGMKSIRVRVSWTYGGNPYSYETESVVTR